MVHGKREDFLFQCTHLVVPFCELLLPIRNICSFKTEFTPNLQKLCKLPY